MFCQDAWNTDLFPLIFQNYIRAIVIYPELLLSVAKSLRQEEVFVQHQAVRFCIFLIFLLYKAPLNEHL